MGVFDWFNDRRERNFNKKFPPNPNASHRAIHVNEATHPITQKAGVVMRNGSIWAREDWNTAQGSQAEDAAVSRDHANKKREFQRKDALQGRQTQATDTGNGESVRIVGKKKK